MEAMGGTEANSKRSDLEALGALQADAPELDRIEALLDRFNVFETIGFVTDELMHSSFLAFLLDPKRNDGLGDLLLKEVLREGLTAAHGILPPSVFGGLDRVLQDLDSMDLGRTVVRREHRDIDILLTNEAHKFAVIIENKICSPEQSGQLDKYDRIVRHSHPGWDVLKIYLTPYGATPTHEEYVPLSYGSVCDIVDRILEDRGSTLDPDVRMSMEHYVGMVRRNILGDPEVVRQCQEMYRKHKRALDLIYKHRPDVRAQIRPIVEDLIRRNPRLKPDASTKDNIRFVVGEWDKAPALLTAEKRTPYGRILIFEVWNKLSSLNLHLFINPGPESIRRGLLKMVRANPEVFSIPSSDKSKWLSIYFRQLLNQEAYEVLDEEEREQEIRERWEEFLENDLPRIETFLKRETWIWESTETGEGR